MTSNKPLVFIYSPSMGGNVGHGLSYGTNILKQFGKRDINVKLYTVLSNVNQKFGKDIEHNICTSKFVINGRMQKSYYSKYKIFSDIIYGIARVVINIKLISEFKKISNKAHFIHFYDYEYFALYIYFRFIADKSKRHYVNFHSTDFAWVKERKAIINIYKYTLRYFVKYILSQSETVFVHGQLFKQQLSKITKDGKSKKIKIIPYGIDNNSYDDDSQLDKYTAREMLNLNFKSTYGLFFGVLRRSKGLIELIEALKYCDDENITLLIAGSPGDISRNQLINTIEKNDMQSKVVHRIEYIKEEDIIKYYSSADFIFIPHSKIHGGFSGPLSLAAQYSTPVLASDHPQISQYVLEYKLGIVFNNDNFCQRLKDIRVNLFNIHKEAEYKRCRDENSWSTLVNIYLLEYQKCIH